MKASFYHMLWSIKNYRENIQYYKEMFKILGIQTSYEGDNIYCIESNGLSIWIMESTSENQNDRDSFGMNHFALRVDTIEEVNEFTEKFLSKNSIEALFDTPKHREDFSSDTQGYFQVMFEMPGGILLEVVSTEKKH